MTKVLLPIGAVKGVVLPIVFVGIGGLGAVQRVGFCTGDPSGAVGIVRGAGRWSSLNFSS